MSVQASLTDFDTQTVLLLRFCQCGCRPEMQLQLDEFPLPMHELDLAELAELSELPVHRACSYCGRDTAAICRAAAVVPAERGLPALTHVRMGDDEPVYALLDRGDSDDPEAAARAIFESFPDPQRRRLVAADEVALIGAWGRTLSTQAFVRALFADFLASGKVARVVVPSEGLAYGFVRRGEDSPTRDDIAGFLVSSWGVEADALVSVPLQDGLGPIIECLGLLRVQLDTASVLCLADATVLERLTRDAVGASGLTFVRADGKLDGRVLTVAAGELEGSLALAEVARSALLYGRTVAEAASLEAQRLALTFADLAKHAAPRKGTPRR